MFIGSQVKQRVSMLATRTLCTERLLFINANINNGVSIVRLLINVSLLLSQANHSSERVII